MRLKPTPWQPVAAATTTSAVTKSLSPRVAAERERCVPVRHREPKHCQKAPAGAEGALPQGSAESDTNPLNVNCAPNATERYNDWIQSKIPI